MRCWTPTSVAARPYERHVDDFVTAEQQDRITVGKHPHIEGGHNPLKRFEAALANTAEPVRLRFYRDNFVDLMGEGLVPDLR